ncbi:hypothetical protein [Ruminococcus flavefaciens]|uniref:hypothetical protein n=1 Tax=Ruminococcus flavefaciens TaxID=1265 RepID=UPI00048DA432|nr:hypothetical protein [Ruminococcus flavefaciens]
MKKRIIGAALALAMVVPTSVRAVNINNTFNTTIAITAEAAEVHVADAALVKTGYDKLIGINWLRWKYVGTGTVFKADNKIYSGKKVVVYRADVKPIRPIFFKNAVIKNIYVIFVDGKIYIRFNVKSAGFIKK